MSDGMNEELRAPALRRFASNLAAALRAWDHAAQIAYGNPEDEVLLFWLSQISDRTLVTAEVDGVITAEQHDAVLKLR